MPAATGAAVAVHEQEQGQDQHRPSRTTPPNRPDRQGFSVDGRGVARVGPCSLTGRARRLARDLGGELARAAGEVAGAERLQVLAHGRGLVGKGGQHAVDLGQQRAQCEPQHAADQAPGHHEHERGRDQPRDAKGRRSERRVGDTRHPRPQSGRRSRRRRVSCHGQSPPARFPAHPSSSLGSVPRKGRVSRHRGVAPSLPTRLLMLGGCLPRLSGGSPPRRACTAYRQTPRGDHRRADSRPVQPRGQRRSAARPAPTAPSSASRTRSAIASPPTARAASGPSRAATTCTCRSPAHGRTARSSFAS